MPEEKKEKKKGIPKIVWWILGIILVIALISACSSDVSNDSSKKKEAGVQTAEEELQAVGEELQVGEVKWQVLEVNKQDTIGDDLSKKTAGGIFVVIKLRAELTGKDSGTVDSNQFEIIDSQDRIFEPSSEGSTAIMFSGKEELFLKQVHPNVPIEGYIVFDIAKDATGLKLKVKDLAFTSDDYGYFDLGI